MYKCMWISKLASTDRGATPSSSSQSSSMNASSVKLAMYIYIRHLFCCCYCCYLHKHRWVESKYLQLPLFVRHSLKRRGWPADGSRRISVPKDEYKDSTEEKLTCRYISTFTQTQTHTHIDNRKQVGAMFFSHFKFLLLLMLAMILLVLYVFLFDVVVITCSSRCCCFPYYSSATFAHLNPFSGATLFTHIYSRTFSVCMYVWYYRKHNKHVSNNGSWVCM